MTTASTAPPLYTSPAAASWRTTAPEASVHALHRSMPGYAPTPLRELPALAGELGVGRVFVKDESDRLGLPAFKILGASWAVCRAVVQWLGVSPECVTVAGLQEQLAAAGSPDLGIVTATDGNHGRAAAHMAGFLGLRARVYVPAGVSEHALAAIRAEGAEVIPGGPTYDDAVATAAASAAADPRNLLVQDTSTPTIMAGLNCGTPSGIGWPTMLAGMSGAVAVSDDQCREAVHRLQGLGQDSGPCGAASLAGARELLGRPEVREGLGIHADPVVVLVSTEGLAANPLPEDWAWGPGPFRTSPGVMLARTRHARAALATSGWRP